MQRRLSKLGTALAAVILLVASAYAQPIIKVAPSSPNFGSVVVGQSRAIVIVITNAGTQTLTVSGISLNAGDSADFTTPSIPTTPFDLSPRRSKRVYISYSPSAEGAISATLEITSNDPNKPVVNVTLTGNGRSANQLGIDKIIAFFDESASPSDPNLAITLQGVPGSWPGLADIRLHWMRTLLATAQNLDNAGWTEWAWIFLYYAYLRCDGQSWPPDLVQGEACPQLAQMIWDSLDSYLNSVKPIQPR
jgi:Abnormal spindle-like microcephaly-assoc'd, ASPM-SPD-2-Hydin